MSSIESGASPERQPLCEVARVLMDTDQKLAVLHDEARTSLVAGDMAGYTACIYDQTNTIAGLSDRIEACRASGADVKDDVQSFAFHHSELARQALDEGDEYTRVAFMPVGSDKNGPTSLKLLAEGL